MSWSLSVAFSAGQTSDTYPVSTVYPQKIKKKLQKQKRQYSVIMILNPMIKLFGCFLPVGQEVVCHTQKSTPDLCYIKCFQIDIFILCFDTFLYLRKIKWLLDRKWSVTDTKIKPDSCSVGQRHADKHVFIYFWSKWNTAARWRHTGNSNRISLKCIPQYPPEL